MSTVPVRRVSAVCVVLSLTLLAFDAPVRSEPENVSPAYALINARIVPVSGPAIESGTLVMRDGRIVAVGPDVRAPADAIVMDADGWTLYPGFIDAHSSVGMPTPSSGGDATQIAREAAARRDRGDPTPGLEPDTVAAPLYDVDADDVEAAHRMGITVAAVAPPLGILAGQSSIVALREGRVAESVISDRWAQHIGFEPFSGRRRDYPSTLMGVIATIRQHYSDAAWYGEVHARFAADPTALSRPEYDPRLAALQPSQAGQQPVVFSAWSDNAILRTLALSDELGLDAVVSGAIDGWRVATELEASGLPVLVSLDHRPRRDPSGFGAAPAGGLMAFPGAADREDAETNPARLHEAGVRFALTSHGLENPTDFLPNLRVVVMAGLPEDVALEALTRTPAQMLGVDDQFGSLEVGKAAHVVAINGDLFDEDATVAAVWVDGQRYDVETPASSGTDGGGRLAEADEDENEDDGEQPDRRALIERRAPDGPMWPEVPVTAIRHATILTVTDGTIPSGTIVMQSGRIVAVGPDAEVAVPAGAREIDATGLHVMPGIVDAHIHIAMAGGGNESTQPVTPEVRIADVIDHRSPSIFRALSLGVTTVNVLHGSANVIGGQNAVIKMRWGKSAAELFVEGAQPGVKFALGENPKQSNRPAIPGVPRRYPSTRMGVEHELRTSFSHAQQYQAEWHAYETAKAAGDDPMPPRRDLRMEALVGILEGRILVHAHSYRSDEILMLLRVAEDFGFWLASLQHVLEGYKVADEIARHGAGASTFSDGWGYKMEAFDAIPYNMAIMRERGVTVSINSDAVGELGTRLYTQAAKAMKYGGVSETDALKMITINPANHLRLDDRIGSIEVGKEADLAVFTAHPFSAEARVRYTLIDGQVYFDSEKVETTSDVLRVPSAETDAEATNGECTGTNGNAQEESGSLAIADRFVAWQAQTEPAGDAGRLQAPSSYGDRSGPDLRTSGAVAIVGGRIITMAGAPIESGTLLIRDGRIAAVGSDVQVPADARVIRADGMIVTPGVINAGTSLGLSEIGAVAATQDANEFADVNAAVKAAVALNAHSEMLPVTRVNGVTTAVVAPGGGMVNGQSALIDLDGWTPPELVARSPLAMHIDFPELVNPPEDDDEARERIDEQRETLRQWMRRAQAHAGAMAEGRTLARSDDHDELSALVPVVRGELPVVIEAQSAEGIEAALAFTKAFGLRTILAASRDVWKVVDRIAEAGVPVVLGPLPGRATQHDPYDAVVVAASLLQEAGVPFAFRTGGATNARNLPEQVAVAVAHGLSRDAAWHAMTRGAAEIFGVDELYGSLEVGKVANVVVSNGDLLDVPTQVQHVLIRGREIDLESRHTRLWQRFRARPLETR